MLVSYYFVLVHFVSKIFFDTSICSACACGMNEWSVECECGADEWMSKWSADGMNVIVLHELRATHGLKTELFSVAMKHIYTKIGVCERNQETKKTRETREKEIRERERQETEDRNKECPFGRLFST